MTQRTTAASTTPTSTPRTAEQAREPREELLSGSTPGAMPKGHGVITPDDADDRARQGADDRQDDPDALKIR